MWNAPKWQTPESDILSEHIRVLENAVAEASELPVGGPNIQKALDYFTARLIRQGGINLFLYGMRERRVDCLVEGLALMKKHLGR